MNEQPWLRDGNGPTGESSRGPGRVIRWRVDNFVAEFQSYCAPFQHLILPFAMVT
jgi:hypothetical protein